MRFVQNDGAEAAGLSFPRPSDAQFYDAASKLGVDQSAFCVIDSLAQCRVIEACLLAKRVKALFLNIRTPPPQQPKPPHTEIYNT